jgi:hypothetical protein
MSNRLDAGRRPPGGRGLSADGFCRRFFRFWRTSEEPSGGQLPPDGAFWLEAGVMNRPALEGTGTLS